MATSKQAKPAETAAPSAKVVTGKVRFSYLHAWEPDSMEGEDEKKYSVSLLIDKDDEFTLNAIRKAIKIAHAEGMTKKWAGKPPTGDKANPLRDGDAERPDDDNYAGKYFLNAKSKNQPGIVDKNVQKIIDQSELYSGCYGRASVNFFAYNHPKGGKGIAVGLNHLQKLSDGDPLGGGSRAEDDFSDSLDSEDSDDFLD